MGKPVPELDHCNLKKVSSQTLGHWKTDAAIQTESCAFIKSQGEKLAISCVLCKKVSNFLHLQNRRVCRKIACSETDFVENLYFLSTYGFLTFFYAFWHYVHKRALIQLLLSVLNYSDIVYSITSSINLRRAEHWF